VINSSDDNPEGKAKCVPAVEDYYECLHHRKEVRLTPSQIMRITG
jgi:NADH dehydrogenase (ubiquinone) Fe-S protein 5